MINEKLGNFIKEQREKNGISQRELARNINVNNKTIHNIEKGLINKVSFDILIKISQQLDINLKELLKLSNYSEKEMDDLFKIVYNYFNDELLLIEDFKEEEILQYTVVEDDMRYIDITKVLNAFKNNEIDEIKAVKLIAACKTIPYGNKEVYVTEKGNIEIGNE